MACATASPGGAGPYLEWIFLYLPARVNPAKRRLPKFRINILFLKLPRTAWGEGQDMARSALRSVPLWQRCAVAVPGLVLAAFFGFVGWHKAFSPLAELSAHHAWTVHVPWWLGKAVGWSEMAAAVALLAGIAPRGRPAARIGAATLALNQVCAALVHLTHGEADALGQNLVLFVALGLVARAAGNSSEA